MRPVQSNMASIAFLLFLLFIAGIVLALIALSSVRSIESTLKSFPLSQLTFRVYQLEQKLAELQKLVSTTAPPTPPPAPPATVQAAPEPHPTQPSAIVGAPPPQTVPAPKTIPASAPQPFLRPTLSLPKSASEPSSTDLENLIGGRWFNRIGIIALLFAVSYFLKLAFDNNWIGPAGRVAIGIFLGLLMLPWSEWLLSRDYTYFSEGIAGLGEATLFVSVWCGCQYYTLFSRQTGFAALVLVTALMAYLALRRDSERIAFLSLLGGVLTPALMSSGKNEQVILFSYLLLLGAAALFIGWRKDWRFLLPLAFVATHLYFWQWYDQFYNFAHFLGSTLFFTLLIFLLYAVAPAVRALLSQSLRAVDIVLVLGNAFAYIVILYALLWPSDRTLLTLFFLALAIVHQAIALLLPDPDADHAATTRLLYTALAVACLTLAIPARLQHNAVTLALSVEGAVLVSLGFRFLGNLLRPFGYFILFLAVMMHLLVQPPAAGTFLFNERFGTYFVLIAGLAVCLWFAASSPDPSFRAESAKGGIPLRSPHEVGQSGIAKSETRPAEAAFLSIAVNFFALLALSQEFWDYFGKGPRSIDHSLAQHLSISILWTAYAGLLLLLGVLQQLPVLRWQALILLGIVVFKVFFYDLSFLDRAYRILSFFILGTALLGVSFFYQRKLARSRSAP
jgi:uncharacterized membrane protein